MCFIPHSLRTARHHDVLELHGHRAAGVDLEADGGCARVGGVGVVGGLGAGCFSFASFADRECKAYFK